MQHLPRIHGQRLRYGALVAALGLVIVSCGSDGADTGTAASEATTAEEMDMDAGEVHSEDEDAGEVHSEDEDGGEVHSEEFGFGDPMEAADASRVIEIKALDDFTFDPASVKIEAGETVTFRVENVGLLDHDFTLGDSETQDEHEAEMVEMAASGNMAMHDEPNAFGLTSGEVKEMTWHFAETGEILFGCHTPGHYPAGMVGSLTIEA
ncbi:MAG: putative cupredoxin-like copper-binding protein [Ilumatobacter sp.]|jgi:uncharacterized cupredoxin-like copper-binding protein